MKPGYRCSHCYASGHTHRTCPELHDGRLVNMSKHVRFQTRHVEQGLCRRCREPLSPRSKVFCTQHLEITNTQKARRSRKTRQTRRAP